MSMLSLGARNAASKLHDPSEFHRSSLSTSQTNPVKVLLGPVQGPWDSKRLSTFVATLRRALPAPFAYINAPEEVRL
jgi:hypothetical protein